VQFDLNDELGRASLESKITLDDYQSSIQSEATGFFDTLRSTFPFSLVAAPLGSITTSSAIPTFDYVVLGTTYSFSLAPFDPLFVLIRAIMGVLLIWGFYLTILRTVARFSGG
jgi:hypothetical protein